MADTRSTNPSFRYQTADLSTATLFIASQMIVSNKSPNRLLLVALQSDGDGVKNIAYGGELI